MRVLGGLLAALIAAACGKVNELDGDAGPDGADGGDVEIVCSSGFEPWLEAAFEFPDGGYLGVTDFPSSPWRVSGTMTPQDGRARSAGAATAVANQGRTFGGTAIRLRYVFVASADDEQVEVFINADDAGDDGLSIGVDAATGELSVRESGRPVTEVSLGALDLDTAYFIEATVDGAALRATLATENFASVSGADVIGELTTRSLAEDTAGGFTGIRFAGGGSVDDVSIALCGETPPGFERQFFDDFERANSATIGSAVSPSVAWMNDSADVSINGGALVFSAAVVPAADPGQQLIQDGLRIRVALRFGPMAWFLVGVNDDLVASGFGTTVDIFRSSDTETFIEYGGPPADTFGVNLDPSTLYFLEMTIDGTHAATTVRTGAFDGPVVFTFPSDSVPAPVGTGVNLGSIGPGMLTIDELAIERYAPPAE